MVQEKIADSWMEIEQFRLLVLRTAWKIDKYKDYLEGPQGYLGGEGSDAEGIPRRRGPRAAPPWLARRDPRDAVRRAGDRELPHGTRRRPTEVHKITVARQLLRERQGTDGLFPTQHIPALREAAIAKYADRIEQKVISAS